MSAQADAVSERTSAQKALVVLGSIGKVIVRIPEFVAELVIIRLTSLMLVTVLSIASIGSGFAMVVMMYREVIGLAKIAINHEGFILEDVATEFTIAILSTIDEVLIAGVLAMVIHGSYTVYVKPAVKSVITGKPWEQAPAFKNLSSGTLKEKVISTIKIASAIFLFRQIIVVGSSGYPTWEKIVMIGGYHLLFIVGYAVMTWANNKHDTLHAAPTDGPHPSHGEPAHAVPADSGDTHSDPASAESHSDHDLPRAA
jgi:uncharacterized membrane protein YqhA